MDEALRQRFLKRIKGLRLMDDDFLSVCMQDNIPGAQLIVRIVLDDDSLVVKHVETQREYKSLSEHSYCFDVYAEDAEGHTLEIEVQRKSAGARPERAACHSGVLDANSMKKNDEDYRHKIETYTIFFTEHDILAGNLPIYHIDRRIEELGCRLFGDKSHIIYVNAAYKGDIDTPLARLVHDMLCTNPEEMHYAELSERAGYFKDEETGAKIMCEAWKALMDEGMAKGLEEGIAKGREEGRMEAKLKALAALADAVRSLSQNAKVSVAEAMKMMGLSAEKQAAVRAVL